MVVPDRGGAGSAESVQCMGAGADRRPPDHLRLCGVENPGATELRIVRVAADVAGSVEMHEMTRAGDMMRMAPVKAVTVPRRSRSVRAGRSAPDVVRPETPAEGRRAA